MDHEIRFPEDVIIRFLDDVSSIDSTRRQYYRYMGVHDTTENYKTPISEEDKYLERTGIL